jgi:hypothetical protein
VTAPEHRSKRDVRRRCRFIDTLSVSDRDCPWLLLRPGRAAVPTFGMSCLPCPQSGRVGFAFIGTQLGGVAAMIAAIPELGLSADAMFVVSMALAAQSAACPEIDTR